MINPVFAVMVLVGLALPLLPTRSDDAERRLYWIGAAVAVVAAFLMVYPPDWRGGLVFAGSLAGVVVLRAYMSTSHLRIRGRMYAFNLRNSDRDPGRHPAEFDAYAGLATAPKMWWLFAAVAVACALIGVLYLLSSDGKWYAAGSGLVVVVLPLMIGHQDASWGYRIARGQIVQLVVAGVATLGVFALVYLLGYQAGIRWPWRSEYSPEHRRRR